MVFYKRLLRLKHFQNLLTNERYRKYSTFNKLKLKIEMTGPITVADYMKEILTSPTEGYYMKNDVFGKQGDFITSPEISQLLGEIVAIWTISEWQKLGGPVPCQIIELGPGRGTMMQDTLRVCSKLKLFPNENDLSVHLLEISPTLSEIQGKNLCIDESIEKFDESNETVFGCYQRGVTKDSLLPIFWYKDLRYIPKIFSIVVAHEFFDALPIHKFQKVGNEWREILVDVGNETNKELRYVISRGPTPASFFFTKDITNRDHLEVSPKSGIIMKELSSRLEEYGGFLLVIDYGHDGDKSDTFRAFKQHKLHDPLVDPGTADLTADVDFSYLRKISEDKLISFGPISQRQFLTNMHIDVRLKVLLKAAENDKVRDNLMSGYRMIMDKEQMGERFKMMSFFPSVLSKFLKQFPVAGFG